MATAPKNTSTNPPVADDDDDFMDGASSEFAKAEHLAPSLPPNFGPGRLVAIWPLSAGSRKSNTPPYKDYPFVETVTLVLDEGPNGQDWLTGQNGWDANASTLVPAAPARLDKFQHSTGGLVARLTPRLTSVNPKTGVPNRFRPLFGRLNTQPSSNNKNVAAYSISEPTEADWDLAKGKYKDLIKGINRELEDAESKKDDEDAFS